MNNFLEKCYALSPVALQNIMVSGYGLIEHRRRFLGAHRKHLQMLRLSARYDHEQAHRSQLAQLKEMLAYCKNEVPYYRSLFERLAFEPEAVTSFEDLNNLPILEKETLRRDPTLFRADNELGRKPIIIHTSGTTGKALTIYCDLASRQRHYAFWSRLREWNGLTKGDRRATLFGRVICDANEKNPPFWRYDFVGRNLLMSSYHLSLRNLPHYLKKLESYQPAEIIGYPSSVFQLATQALNDGKIKIRPKVVFATAETLTEIQRRVISDAFQCPVVDQYGCAEMVTFVSECPFGNYHVHPEHGILQVVDQNDNPVANGEIGEAVCTGFVNRAMPLIRYRLGDRVRLARSTCPCGYQTQVLQEICGRSDDILYTVDGRPIGRLSPVWKVVDGIMETQVVQHAMDRIDVNIVLDTKIENIHGCRRNIEAELRKRVGDAMKLNFNFVDRLAKDKNGKFRPVISLIKHPSREPVGPEHLQENSAK